MNRAFVAAKHFLSRTAVVATVVLMGMFCLAVVQLSSLPFVKAIECAERGEGPFPFEKAICRHHVFWFRGSEADIASLEANRSAINLLAAKSNQHTVAERAEMLYFLAEHGLDVNAKESDLWTPLHAAIRDNDVEGVSLLLRLHPNLNIKAGPEELTALEYAKELHRETIVRRLLTEAQEQKNLQRALDDHLKNLENMQMYGGEFTGVQSPAPEQDKPDRTHFMQD